MFQAITSKQINGDYGVIKLQRRDYLYITTLIVLYYELDEGDTIFLFQTPGNSKANHSDWMTIINE